MANYECITRTNYFRVKDPDAFRELMGIVSGDLFSFWEQEDKDGIPMFAFGCYGDIQGIPHENKESDVVVDDNSYDHFVEELKRHVAEGEAVILMTAGHEKLRCVEGDALVITGKGTGFINLSTAAVKLASEMLGDPDYDPRMDY